MAHEARTPHAALALLLVLGGCGDGGGDRRAEPPAATSPSSPAPSPAPAAVVYQTFAASGDSDLHAVSEDGAAHMPLAATDRREHFRGISRDGWVVFDRALSEREAELVSVRVTGGETRVLDGSASGKLFRGFTPGGRAVYQKATATGSAIHSIRPDGTAPAVLVDAPFVTAEFVAATALGRVLYQACERPQNPQAPPQCVRAGLYSVGPDGGDRVLLAEGAPRVALVTGERALYERRGATGLDLVSVRADGADAIVLAGSPDDEWNPWLLPDGRVLYSRRVEGQWDVYLVNADGTGARALLHDPEDEFVADVTPAGRILYVRTVGEARNLYAIDPDGTNLAVLGASSDDENLRRVTAEGRVIYSTRRAGGGIAQDDLYSVAPDGTDLRVLADSSDFEWFEDVASDGRVVYMRCPPAPSGPCGDPGAQSDLYSVRQDGAGTTGLATTGEVEVYRAVTAGNRVVYERRVGDQHDLHSVTTGGVEPRALADTPVDERYQGLHE